MSAWVMSKVENLFASNIIDLHEVQTFNHLFIDDEIGIFMTVFVFANFIKNKFGSVKCTPVISLIMSRFQRYHWYRFHLWRFASGARSPPTCAKD